MPSDLLEILRQELNVKKISVAEKLPTGPNWKHSKCGRVALYTKLTPELVAEGKANDRRRKRRYLNSQKKKHALRP